MQWPEFRDIDRIFIVVCFVDEADISSKTKDLEKLGSQRNVRLVVQPCPYEAVAFLFGIDDDLIGHLRSLEKDLYWKSLALRADTPKEVVLDLTEKYHEYFCAILEQDNQRVQERTLQLNQYSEHFAEEASE